MPILGGGLTLAPLEVFWKEHRNLNGKWKVANDLLRYTISELSAGSPLIEVWDPNASAWLPMANYQLQVANTGPVLPVQNVQFQTISPEEIIWVERRYDTTGTALVVVTNRIRRGSRIIESSIVAASGAGLTGTQSIGLIGMANLAHTVAQSVDSTGVVFTSTSKLLPGFCYLTANPTVPTSPSNPTAYAGATVPAGTITRIGILCGVQDAQYTSLGATGALYAARWASYGRQRIRQRILVGLTT